MRVDTELVKKLAEMLDENDLSEIEVEDNGRRIVVKRKLGFAPGASAPAAAPAPAAAAPLAPAPAPAAEPGSGRAIRARSNRRWSAPSSSPPSPARRRSSPPAREVEEGDTLLIIEAMKVMNPITAPKAGTVKEILVQDAQPVEYEQPLAIIE